MKISLTGWARTVAAVSLALLTCGIGFASSLSPERSEVPASGPTIDYTGGFTLDDPDNNLETIADVFTWSSRVDVTGSGWGSFENVHLFIYGPLNAPWTGPSYRQVMNALGGSFLQDFPSDEQGKLLTAHFFLPYTVEDAVLSPGLYRIRAVHANQTPAQGGVDSRAFNLAPDTIVNNNGVIGPNWGFERGARDGFLGDTSPERTDPEWVTVWSKKPVGLYATVAPTNDDGGNQPAHISYHEYPWTHYGHDVNLLLVPDDDYRWVIATANYRGHPESKETGRIEWEWETQNSGHPYVTNYGHGVIGFPLFATPTVGDRVYTVGAWALDNGHPDEGDRSEIHPPRMIATMRKLYTVVPFGGAASECKTKASQVDIYVSGHGGGLNRYYDELERLLDNGGAGGARVRNFMPGAADYSSVYRVYQQVGPASSIDGLNWLLDLANWLGATPDLNTYAGPSALYTTPSGDAGFDGIPWVKGPEERPIYDMDYEFDAPLPPAPAGATHPMVATTQYPLHTTHVEEVITYVDPDPATGLPTKAHIKIPYASSSSDNGMYARTLNFYWDKFSAPGSHYVVAINSISSSRSHLSEGQFDYYLGPQPLYLWTDVSGQWRFLTELNVTGFTQPTISTSGGVDTVGGLGQARFDVYLEPSDALRVYTTGYAQRDVDTLFGNQDALSAYDAGIQVAYAALIGSGDNQNIGGAVLDLPLSNGIPQEHQSVATTGAGGVNTVSGAFPNVPSPVFTMDVTASHVLAPPHLDVLGRTSMGDVCIGGTAAIQLLVKNSGESPLDIKSFAISGAGYSIQPDPDAPYTLPGGEYAKLNVIFSPTAVGQGAGTLTIASSDPCTPSLDVALTANVIYSTLVAAPAQTVFGPTVAPCGSVQTTVRVTNAGHCDLIIDNVSMLGPSYTVAPGTLPLTLAPGGTATFTVKFQPKVISHSIPGTLTIHSNDPQHPNTSISFCGEGVGTGIRVIVLQANGTPYPLVDQITVTSSPTKTNVNQVAVPLTVLGPPSSCQTLKYHLDAQLPPSDTSGKNPSTYELKVRIGNTTKRMTFTVGSCESKPITVQFP